MSPQRLHHHLSLLLVSQPFVLVFLLLAALAVPASAAACGDGRLEAGEACDDGGVDGGDGCAADCRVETGFRCTVASPSVCDPVCGDGAVVAAETCDDANAAGGDGCSSRCGAEGGYYCDLGTQPTPCYALTYTMSGGMPPAAFERLDFVVTGEVFYRGRELKVTRVPEGNATWEFMLSTSALCADSAAGTDVVAAPPGSPMTFSLVPLHEEAEVVVCAAQGVGAAFEKLPGVFAVGRGIQRAVVVGASVARRTVTVRVARYRAKLSARRSCDAAAGGDAALGAGASPLAFPGLTATFRPDRDGVVFLCLSDDNGFENTYVALEGMITVYPALEATLSIVSAPVGGLGVGAIAVDNPGMMRVSVELDLLVTNVLAASVAVPERLLATLPPRFVNGGAAAAGTGASLQLAVESWHRRMEPQPAGAVACSHPSALRQNRRVCNASVDALAGFVMMYYFTVAPAAVGGGGGGGGGGGVNTTDDSVVFASDLSVGVAGSGQGAIVRREVTRVIALPEVEIVSVTSAVVPNECGGEEGGGGGGGRACEPPLCRYADSGFRLPRCLSEGGVVEFEVAVRNTKPDSDAGSVQILLEHSDPGIRFLPPSAGAAAATARCGEHGPGTARCVFAAPLVGGEEPAVLSVRFLRPSAPGRAPAGFTTSVAIMQSAAWPASPAVVHESAEGQGGGGAGGGGGGVIVGAGDGGGGGTVWWHVFVAVLAVLLCCVVASCVALLLFLEKRYSDDEKMREEMQEGVEDGPL
eukprot:Rhum_TRINITY_DN13347_c1_g1::Rhum_TRINITY_DN13347_c1_g1_i1::g.59053::m.59053